MDSLSSPAARIPWTISSNNNNIKEFLIYERARSLAYQLLVFS
jgi:hypothetical protein